MTDDGEAELLAVQGRLRAVEDRMDALDAAAGGINGKLDELLADQAGRPRNFHWSDLDAADAQERWTAFLEWVQNVLVARYPAAVKVLRPCWWQHLEVVDALTATWLTWLAAYRGGDAAATDAGNWHRTYYLGFLDATRDALASCDRQHEPEAAVPDTMSTVPTTL